MNRFIGISTRFFSIIVAAIYLSGCWSHSFKPIPLDNSIATDRSLIRNPVNVVSESTIRESVASQMLKGNLSQTITENNPDSRVQILVKRSLELKTNPGLGLLNIFVSGCTLFIIPAKTDFLEKVDYVILLDGDVQKTYHYQTDRDQFLWLFNLAQAPNKYWMQQGAEEARSAIEKNFNQKFLQDVANDEALLNTLNNI